jgi:hypothetical protein
VNCAYVIDWAATGQMLAGIGSFIAAGAVLYAAQSGKDALKNFKNQKLAERKIEHAEKILATSYAFRDVILGARHRYIPVFESNSLGVSQNSTVLGEVSFKELVYKRLARENQAFDDEYRQLPYAKVHFGESVSNDITLIIQQRTMLLASLDIWTACLAVGAEVDASTWSTIFGASDDHNDPIKIELDNAVSRLEAVLLPHLNEEGSSRG